MIHFHQPARAVLAAMLVSGLAAAPARSAEVEKYLPDGTQMVVSVNLKQLLSAPLVRADEQAFKNALGEAAKVLEGFGVDPMKDLDRVFVAAGESLQPNSILLLLEGKFDQQKVQTQLKAMAQEKKQIEPVDAAGGAAVYQLKLPREAVRNPGVPSKFLFTVLDGRYIAFAADAQALEKALAKKQGTRKTDVKADMLALIDKINPQESASVVIMPPANLLENSPAAGLTKITGGVTVSEGVKTDLLLTTKDTDTAKNLAQAINDGLAQIKQLVPIFLGQQPNVGPKQIEAIKGVLDSFKATAQPNGVTITSDITKEFIEKNARPDKDK